MFKAVLFATALVAVEAWKRDVKQDRFQTEAYGVDNQNYGHQGYGYGKGYGLGYGHGNSSWRRPDSHNSLRQAGHQGQGHNQWVDNAWNQWGTNNHWDTQKAVDNKWGNNSGRINVNINSVSGHYDNDYGQQQRGIGYEGHQNVSGKIGYTIGLAGHSFGYKKGNHSFGYVNNRDYGYGGWANNLGAWNHGANYDNFGEQHVETGRDQDNDSLDTHEIKENRRVGKGYADIDELDQDDDRERQYKSFQIGPDNRGKGIGNNLGVLGGSRLADRGFGFNTRAGKGIASVNFPSDRRYGGYGLGSSYGGYGGYGGYGYNAKPLGGSLLGRGKGYSGYGLNNGYAQKW